MSMGRATCPLLWAAALAGCPAVWSISHHKGYCFRLSTVRGNVEGEGAACGAVVPLVMPMVRSLQVTQWLMVPLVMLVMRVLLVMTMVRVLLVLVLNVGPCVAVPCGSECGPLPFLAEGLADVACRLARLSWCCRSSPVLQWLLVIRGGGCRW